MQIFITVLILFTLYALFGKLFPINQAAYTTHKTIEELREKYFRFELKQLSLLLLNGLLLLILALSSGCKNCESNSEEEAKAKGKPIYFSDQERAYIAFKDIDTISFLLNKSETVDFICPAPEKDFFCKNDDGQTNCYYCSEKYEYEAHTYTSKSNGNLAYSYKLVHDDNHYPNNFIMEHSLNFNFIYLTFYQDTASWTINYLDTMQVLNKNYKNVIVIPHYNFDGHGKPYVDTIWYTREFGIIKVAKDLNKQFELLGLN